MRQWRRWRFGTGSRRASLCSDAGIVLFEQNHHAYAGIGGEAEENMPKEMSAERNGLANSEIERAKRRRNQRGAQSETMAKRKEGSMSGTQSESANIDRYLADTRNSSNDAVAQSVS